MSANIKEIFREVVNLAIDSAKEITDATHKANAYAEIGKALAMSGLLHEQPNTVSELEELTEEEEKEIGAVSKETKPKKVEKKKKETKKEEVKEEKTLGELFPEEVQFLDDVATEYGAEQINEVLAEFSSGTYKKLEEINAEMIEAFTEYVRELVENSGEEVEEESA